MQVDIRGVVHRSLLLCVGGSGVWPTCIDETGLLMPFKVLVNYDHTAFPYVRKERPAPLLISSMQ
jgi:hypothetical protein